MTMGPPSLLPMAQRLWLRVRDDATSTARRRSLSGRRLRVDRAPATDVTASMTSHRARFGHLALALRSVVHQSLQPSAVLLWIPRQDVASLPADVLALTRGIVEIRTLPRDLGPASKLLPAMAERSGEVIVTADDDVAYPYRWLESLLAVRTSHPDAIVCRRAHWITFDRDGSMRPYADWEWETSRNGPDQRLFFTGHGGVLYPPGALSPDAWVESMRQSTCATNDDIWFNWMARMAGTSIVRVPGRTTRRDNIPGSAQTSLMRVNLGQGANDTSLRAVIAAYGALDPTTGRLRRPGAG